MGTKENGRYNPLSLKAVVGLLAVVGTMIFIMVQCGFPDMKTPDTRTTTKDSSLAPGLGSVATVSATQPPKAIGPESTTVPLRPANPQRAFLTINNDPTWKQVLDHPSAPADALSGTTVRDDWYSPIGMRVGSATPPELCFVPAGMHFATIGTLRADGTEYTAVEYLGESQDPTKIAVGSVPPGTRNCALGTAVRLSDGIQMSAPKK